jgi:peptide/nickel transport system permease protein
MALLWSDLLLYVLLIAAIVFAVRGAHHWHVRAAWKQVMEQPLAIISSVILLLFLSIAFLDSIHWTRGNQQEISAFDVIVEPVGQHYEKTYSSPFALYTFSQEMHTSPDGKTERRYPRLEHAGLGVSSELERTADLLILSSKGLAYGILGFLLWCFVSLTAVSLWQKRACYRVPLQKKNWRLWYFTWLIGIVTLAVLWQWSRHYHIFGTDQVGQDILYLTLKSIRTGVVIGTITTLVMLPFAILLGIAAGYFGGFVDDVIQYIYTTLSSIPSVLLIAAAILSIQLYIANHPEMFMTLAQSADARLLALCLILGVTSWTSLCRLLRAETLKLREMDFIRAAKALGSRSWTILIRHILPNVMHLVLITVVLDFSMLVLAEAVLSYVGVGVAPTTISWGNMINSARLELAREPVVWWPISAAFIFMFLLVLSANLFADAVRDAFDPRS